MLQKEENSLHIKISKIVQVLKNLNNILLWDLSSLNTNLIFIML